MLALWSRTARTPGTCRCISCVSNGSIIARRAGALSSKGGWALGAPTSTFVYTAVFTAGLAVDAKAKGDRNRQWDTAFAQLREELELSSAQEKGAMTGYQAREGGKDIHDVEFESLESPVPPGVSWDTIYRVSGMELDDDSMLQPRPAEIDMEHISEGLWDLLSFDSKLPGAPELQWPANTGPELIRHYLPPQSLWSPEHMRWTAIRKRQTWKKLAIQELSVSMLIHGLLEKVDISQLPETTLASLSPHIQYIAQLDKEQNQSAQREISRNIKQLQNLDIAASSEQIANTKVITKGPATPQYFQDADGDFHHICQQMNTAIRNLFYIKWDGQANDDRTALAIAKICHNLLVSSAAPDLQTFNILISGFKRWNHSTIVDHVIAAFYRCKIRPNEITCASILDHYVQTNRPNQFSRFVALMRGVGDALMLANPGVTINEAGQDRLVRVSETKVYQKVYPTPMVFNALMHGVLHFAGFERAMDIYYEMKQDGWGLDVRGLCHFLRDCMQRADWAGGLYIWEEINSIKHQARPANMAKAYAQMLTLCSVTGNTVAFNQILKDVVRCGFDRKAVLNSAMKMTRGTKRKVDTLAPAWAADNLLIAMSGYMKTENAEEHDAKSLLEEADPFEPTPEMEEPVQVKHKAKDTEDAWVMWMEHELGEQIKKDPPAQDAFNGFEYSEALNGSRGSKDG